MTEAAPPTPGPYRPSPADRRRARRDLAKMVGILALMAAVVALAWNPVANFLAPPDTPLQAAARAGDLDGVRRTLGPAGAADAAATAYSAYQIALGNLSPSNPDTTEILRLILDRKPAPPTYGTASASPLPAANTEFRIPHKSAPTTTISAVEIAAQRWSPDGVRQLLAHGLIVKSVSVSGALTAAVANGCEPIIRLLLDAGADVNARDRNRDTPLAMARRLKQADLVALLVARGAHD